MSFTFARRTMQIGVWKNLYKKKGDEYVSGLDLPVIFTLREKDFEIVVPTPESKEGEASFPSLLELMFDAENRCLHPELSPMSIHRKPEELDVTFWPDADDERRKFTVNGVKAKGIKLSFMSGNGKFGSLEMDLEIRDLTPELHIQFIKMQKQARDISIKGTINDLFEKRDEAPNPTDDEERTEDQQQLPGVPPAPSEDEDGADVGDDNGGEDDGGTPNDPDNDPVKPKRKKKAKKKPSKK